ncbi:hypothetical protein F7647_10890 [Tenacibaculum piscium]|uniref:hypothetical protein n=1 Tax=Tenacibaculum piscium TaxID=1458515 RepID=UPI00187B4C31|nr:hypothetical protein [Tenacibaculum piscium]MBE7686556.1 hypothetical protein [Tenacibaculum piscium]MBE7691245.1 hypothetical protein [Tenacibaculum piscium]
MYWLAIPILLGIYALFNESSSKEEKNAKENWVNKKKDIQHRIIENRSEIEQKISNNKNIQNFEVLRNMHYSSFTVANVAWKLLEDAKTYIHGIENMISNSIKEKNKTSNKNDLNKINNYINALKREKEKIKTESNKMRTELTKLNSQTSRLKYTIRNKCGHQGENWYNRLEERKRRK